MIQTELSDGVLTLTLCRPDKHNALTLAMREQLEALPETYGQDPDVRCVILTGAGTSFCAGADLAEITALDGSPPPTKPTAGLLGLGKPIIAAINGVCVTGGLELALACPIILAADTARFADTHLKMGVLPRWGMSALLPRRVGQAAAMDISLTSRWVDAPEALALGLVNRVVPADDLLAAATEAATAIASRPPQAVAAMTKLLETAQEKELARALRDELDLAQNFGLDQSAD